MPQDDPRPVLDPVDVDAEEPAADAVEAVVLRVLARCAAGVGIAGRADGELVEPGLGVNRVVLPVAVADDDQEAVVQVRAEPLADRVAFVAEGRVGVIVGLVAAVRTDDRRGRDEDLPVRVAGEQGVPQPAPLLGAPRSSCRGRPACRWASGSRGLRPARAAGPCPNGRSGTGVPAPGSAPRRPPGLPRRSTARRYRVRSRARSRFRSRSWSSLSQ